MQKGKPGKKWKGHKNHQKKTKQIIKGGGGQGII